MTRVDLVVGGRHDNTGICGRGARLSLHGLTEQDEDRRLEVKGMFEVNMREMLLCIGTGRP